MRAERIVDHYPVLRSLAQDDVLKVLSNAKIISFRAGSTVFEELQPCEAFPFILAGNIRVVKRAENGREISLYNVTTGDACVVSAACLLGNKPYNAVGIVQTDCELALIPAQDFDHLMSVKVFREHIFSLFSNRVLALMELIDQVAFRKLDQRLARVLLAGAPEIRLSHQQLADELGTVREMITRLLNDFSDRGLVKAKRGSVQILDRLGLRQVAEFAPSM